MRRVSVHASCDYDICIGRGLLDRCGDLCYDYLPCGRLCVITDDNVGKLYADRVVKSLESAGNQVFLYTFPHGEGHKTVETVGEILEFLADCHMTRADGIVALGGGIVGDVAGFAASIYLRGIDFMQIPTTFLAAVDSSVGGKTGVNLPQGKNLAGAFHQPVFVLCDCDCFQTLEPDVFADGVAEAVKYGVLGDTELFTLLRTGDLQAAMEDVVERCVAMKARFVAEDEFDKGQRQFLNLGHTVGHAIEKCSHYAISHGHAVAIGMVYAAKMARNAGILEEDMLPALTETLVRHNLPTAAPFAKDDLLAVMAHDKKRMGNRLTFVFPKRIGACLLQDMWVQDLAPLMEDL